MSNYLEVVVYGEYRYLNDVLLELDYYVEPLEVVVEEVKFLLSPPSANEYIKEYGEKNYRQMVCGKGSLSHMRRLVACSGGVVEEVGNE